MCCRPYRVAGIGEEEMITFLFNHMILAGFNLINSRIDAYRILQHKPIAHGINFTAYLIAVAVIVVTGRMHLPDIILLCISAFCNRQISFDIPLNLRRGLKWDYVSTAKPPKAFLDRIEIRIWGYNGRAPILFYSLIWAVCLGIKAIL